MREYINLMANIEYSFALLSTECFLVTLHTQY